MDDGTVKLSEATCVAYRSVLVISQTAVVSLVIKPWENHRKTMGKPWENGGLMGFNGIYPLVMTHIATENHPF